MHIGLGIRCDLSPCQVQGSLDIRVKNLRLPTRVKPKSKADFGAPSHGELVERHWPRNIRLVVAGRTIRYLDWFVDHTEEVEPHLQYSTISQALRARGGPLLQPGSRPGVLTFRSNTGTFRIPVTVRIVRVA
jgi:hypothetical protein